MDKSEGEKKNQEKKSQLWSRADTAINRTNIGP